MLSKLTFSACSWRTRSLARFRASLYLTVLASRVETWRERRREGGGRGREEEGRRREKRRKEGLKGRHKSVTRY